MLGEIFCNERGEPRQGVMKQYSPPGKSHQVEEYRTTSFVGAKDLYYLNGGVGTIDRVSKLYFEAWTKPGFVGKDRGLRIPVADPNLAPPIFPTDSANVMTVAVNMSADDFKNHLEEDGKATFHSGEEALVASKFSVGGIITFFPGFKIVQVRPIHSSKAVIRFRSRMFFVKFKILNDGNFAI